MSVLPTPGLTSLGGVRELMPVQRPAATPSGTPAAPHPAAMPTLATSRAERAAMEHALAQAAQGTRHKADNEPLVFTRQGDQRQLVRTMYRLRNQYATFDQMWKEGEVDKTAEELVLEARSMEGDVYAAARRRQPDAFQRYLALLDARDRMQQFDDELATLRIEAALEEDWAKHQDAIMAGFNSAESLLEYARNFAQWNYFRVLYASLMVHEATLAATFKALLEKFGPARITGAIEALRGAIAADLASPLVSCDRVRLIQSQLDLETTRKMSSLMREGDAVCKKVHGERSSPELVMRFVGGVFDYVGITTYSDQRFTLLCELLNPDDPTHPATRHFLREFLKSSIPLSLWRSMEVRANLFPVMWRNA